VIAVKRQNSSTALRLPEPKGQQQDPGLQVMPKERKKQQVLHKDRKLIAIITAVVLALLFCCVMAEAQVNSVGYEINKTKEAITAMESKSQKLELEVEQLSSLNRIEEYAVNQLGMVNLQSSDIIYIDYNAGLTTAEAAAATTSQPAANDAAVADQAGSGGSLLDVLASLLGIDG
jgi:cell division protein FtsL